MTLLTLWACLCVVFTEVGIIGCHKTNDTLFAFMANINTHKHRLLRDFLSEVHSPKVSSKLGIDLSHNIEIDTIVISINRLARNELRYYRVIAVNLVFNGGIELFLPQTIRNDHEEELYWRLAWVNLFRRCWFFRSSALCLWC